MNRRIKIVVLECKRCAHKWVPRIPEPAVCPNCHSPYWMVKPRLVKNIKPKVPTVCRKCGSKSLMGHADGLACLECGKVVYL